MTYQVLARKYRPEIFQEVVGQEHVTQTLVNAFSQDRIGHAYLFTGPRGVGKTTTARILAKALNCLTSNDGNPCNECQNCTEIATSRSMDVLEIDGASNRGIDEIRNLRELVKYPPINSRFKIFIIDEVHMLTTPAFNALLKTLEEPPPYVKFFFATTEPNKVLPTIMSRCQRHDFNRLSMEDILTGIDPVIEKENIVVDDETRRLTARMADGSMRDALSLLDQMIAFCGNEVTFEKATSLLGIIPDALYFEVTDAVREKDRKKLLELMRSVYAQGFVLNDFIAGLSQHLLNLLVCKAESGEELLDLTADLRDRYAKESRAWDPKDLLRYGDLLTEIETNLKIVQQPRIYVETMMLKLLELDSSVAISDLISRLSADPPGSALLTGPQPPQVGLFTEPSAAAPPEATPKESFPSKGKENKNAVQNDVSEQKAGNEPNVELFEKVKQQWEAIIAKVSGNGTSLATFLSHGKPSGVTGGRLIISFPRKYRFQMDVLKKNALRIESSVEETVGEALKISFVVNQDEPVSEESNREETNPVTKRMLDLFGGEIVE